MTKPDTSNAADMIEKAVARHMATREAAVMNDDFRYELWKTSVITAARNLYGKANAVGTMGIAAIDDYNDAHHELWRALEREPKFKPVRS